MSFGRRTFVLGGLAAGIACGASEGAKLHVLAAASLADVLPVVAARWSSGPDGMPIELVFDATSRLAAQIEAGAPADVFVSADAAWMDALSAKGLVVAATRYDLLGNRLVVVVPAAATATLPDANALRGIGRLAIAGATVPAGKYARAALESLGVLAELEPRIVEGDSVRTALAWVAKGEADAAIVYATDAKVEPAVRVAFALPAASHPTIVYPIAALSGGKHVEAATRFVAHARDAEAAATFRDAGFTPPP